MIRDMIMMYSLVKITKVFLIFEKHRAISSIFLYSFNFKDIMECENYSLGPTLLPQQFQSINKMVFLLK